MREQAAVRYAGVVSRGIAFVVDAAVVVVATVATIVVVYVVASTVGAGPRALARILVPALAVMPPVLLVVYDATFWALTGRTLGKAVLGLRVVRTDGRPVTPGPAVVRALVLVIVFVGALWSIVDRRHQGLHDKVARTVVVYDTRYPAPRLRAEDRGFHESDRPAPDSRRTGGTRQGGTRSGTPIQSRGA